MTAPARIYHLAAREEWDAATKADAPYRMSTKGKTLDEVGFIHCSHAHQVAATYALVFDTHDDIVLLTIDPTRLDAAVRVESGGHGAELFPHVYGPITRDAVVAVEPYPASHEPAKTRASYDRVAASYVDLFWDELDEKPFDREFLDALAPRLAERRGPVVDLGSGPGQIGDHVAQQRVTVIAVDLSREMLVQARHARPERPAAQADMRRLPFADASLGGLLVFYSLIHIRPDGVPATLAELGRVLEPGGLVAIAVHAGDEHLHVDTWHGQPVDLDFTFFTEPSLVAEVEAAGLAIDSAITRGPQERSDEQTSRVYLVARRPW